MNRTLSQGVPRSDDALIDGAMRSRDFAKAAAFIDSAIDMARRSREDANQRPRRIDQSVPISR